MLDRQSLKALCRRYGVTHIQRMGNSDGLAYVYRHDNDGGYSVAVAVHVGQWGLTRFVETLGVPAYSDV